VSATGGCLCGGVAAGTLDQPTGLRSAGHWYVSQAADYYELPDDGLERHNVSGER
jgi:hypothetical protein